MIAPMRGNRTFRLSVGRDRRFAAFTLIDVLMVVIVLGIIASMVAPMAANAAPTKLRAAADLVVGDLGLAQAQSITHADAPRAIVFDVANNSYHLAVADDPDTPLAHPLTRRPHRVTFGQGIAQHLADVQITSATVGDDNTLGFGIYGELDQTENAVITLTAGSRSLTITIDAATGETAAASLN